MQRTEPIETTREYLVPAANCAETGAWIYAPEDSPDYERASRAYVDKSVYRTAELHPNGIIYKYGEEYGARFPDPDDSHMLGMPVRLGVVDEYGFHPDGREGYISDVHHHRLPFRKMEDVYMVRLDGNAGYARAESFQFIPERLPA